ncbi:MAG: nucleotidyltransferase family protein [Proteobacteria bacterium]|jgi:hypothetical protein|nr:nucleotidyltransferase family protein [Pseudomonadota bacterium]
MSSTATPTASDPYYYHRLALAPLLDNVARVDAAVLNGKPGSGGPDEFLRFLIHHGLAPLWYARLFESGRMTGADPAFIEKLRQLRLIAEATYQMQSVTLQKLHAAFTAADISYAVFKGVQVREQVHDNPALRPATDIDVLVSKRQRDPAILALKHIGMQFVPERHNFSHEAVLVDGAINVDLHWDILRPGRTRGDMTESLLQRPVMIDGFHTLRDDASLFVLLVHNAISKYVCAPSATLIRMLDLSLWLDARPVDWDAVLELADQAGLVTAAWATLYWLKLLTGRDVLPAQLDSRIPDTRQRRYLEDWINENRPARQQSLARFRFGLAIHDRPQDALRAGIKLVSARAFTVIPRRLTL